MSHSDSEQSMMTQVRFRVNLIQLSGGIERKLLVNLVKLLRKLLVVRRSLVVQHDEHGRWLRKKAVETIPRSDDARATAWPSCLLGGNEKTPSCFKVQDIKDKIRNKTISDAR